MLDKLCHFSFITIAVALLISVVPPPSFADVVNRNADGLESSMYASGSDKKTLVYKGIYSVSVEGDKATQTNTIKDLNGVMAAKETLEEVNGKFSGYSLERINAGEGGDIKLIGNKLHFRYTKNNKTNVKEIDLPENFVVGPGLTAYAREHWKTIMKGEEIHVKYGVLDRQDIFRFKLFKVREEKRGDEQVVIVNFKPGSFFVSLLVDPVFITFSKDGSKVTDVSGRTFMLQNVNGGWEPLNAETVYHHNTP